MQALRRYLLYHHNAMANARAHHDGRGRFVRVLENAELDREAAVLYQRYSSYRQVAEIQHCDVATAHRRVERAMASIPDDSTVLAKRVALARLTAMAQIAQAVAEEEHLAHSNGRIVGVMDEAGVFIPLRDRTVNLAAIDRLARIEDQRARLQGTYAPTSARVEVIPSDVLEALIAQNEAAIAAAERELGLVPSALEPPEGEPGDA
jgi:alkylated DNA nucleotide flippase Atl1